MKGYIIIPCSRFSTETHPGEEESSLASQSSDNDTKTNNKEYFPISLILFIN